MFHFSHSLSRMLQTFRAGMMWSIALIAAFAYGGEIESRLWPPIVNQTVHNVIAYRTDDGRYQVCWTWTFVRTRPTTVDTASFWGTLNGDPFIYVAISNGDARLDRVVTDYGVQRVPLCVNLPPGTNLEGVVRIDMKAFVRVKAFPIWVVPVEVPSAIWDSRTDIVERVNGLRVFDGMGCKDTKDRGTWLLNPQRIPL